MTLILALIFALVIAVFAIQNASEVLIHFFFWTFKTNLVFVIIGSIAIGAIILFLIGIYRNFIVTKEKNRALLDKDSLEKEKEKLLEELEVLKDDLLRANEALDKMSQAPLVTSELPEEPAIPENTESEQTEIIDQ